MKPKKIYSYHTTVSSLEEDEHGEYGMSHRRPLKLGDMVVLEVYPDFEDVKEYFDHTENYPPEYCVVAKVSRFTDDGFFCKVVMEEPQNSTQR